MQTLPPNNNPNPANSALFEGNTLIINMEELAYAPNFKKLKLSIDNLYVIERFFIDRKHVENMTLEEFTLKGPSMI